MIERKKTLNVFKDARGAWGSYDDFPVGAPGTDPMPHLSRNRVPQPFYLISDRDQVIIQMAGTGELRLHGAESMRLEPGDCAYVPARVPSRLIPDGENVQIRLKAEPRPREAVAWFCACGARVHAIELPADGIAQQHYWDAVHAFNAIDRACPRCAALHARAELGDIAWLDTAAALAND